jgi:hypothetical protein
MRHVRMIGLAAMVAMAFTAALGTGLASATELYRFGAPANGTLGVGTPIDGSLKAGTSLFLKDTFGLDATTCTGSELGMKTESAGGEASHPSGKASTLAFSGCSSGAPTVHAKGSLQIQHIAGTTNGTVTSSGMEVTFPSVFGTRNCKTGAGTDIGTLAGAYDEESHATLNVNAILDCSGISIRLLGTYTITTPTGLNVEAS